MFEDLQSRRTFAVSVGLSTFTGCFRLRRGAITNPRIPGNSVNRFNFDVTTEIVYETMGSGRPLLMLHGFGASKATWFDVQDRLGKRYSLIMPDLKGFGESSKPDDHKYGIPDQAAIVFALIKKLDLSNLTIVGHSYGGSVALLTYLLLKDNNEQHRLRSLVIVDAPAFPQQFPFFISMLRAPLMNRSLLALLPASFRAAYTLNRIFYDKARVTSERIDRYARFFDVPGIHRSMIAAAEQILPANPAILSARLGDFECRVLLVWGENDPVIPLWQAERITRSIRGAELIRIPKCGHVPPEERPTEFLAAVMPFLEAS